MTYQAIDDIVSPDQKCNLPVPGCAPVGHRPDERRQGDKYDD